MGKPDLLRGWSSVDSSPDPSHFISFLDATRSKLLELAKQDPARFFAHLGLREGHHVLEVGCGTGDYARLYAPLVGRSGRVLCVDSSEVMVGEARKRAAGLGSKLEFRVGDAHRLELPDSTFDRCISNIVLQHLARPEVAVAEMVRVAGSGALVIAAEQDWDAFVIDGEPPEVTRAVLRQVSDSIPHGRIGRQLRRMFLDAGLEDVAATPTTLTFADFSLIDRWFVEPAVREAAAAGRMGAEEGDSWLADQRERSRAGRFFASMTLFNVIGRKG
jgi:ubiquinone/menaquinone biosynthesis C-methylase UbiE